MKIGDEVYIQEVWETGVILAIGDMVTVRCECGLVFDYAASTLLPLDQAPVGYRRASV